MGPIANSESQVVPRDQSGAVVQLSGSVPLGGKALPSWTLTLPLEL